MEILMCGKPSSVVCIIHHVLHWKKEGLYIGINKFKNCVFCGWLYYYKKQPLIYREINMDTVRQYSCHEIFEHISNESYKPFIQGISCVKHTSIGSNRAEFWNRLIADTCVWKLNILQDLFKKKMKLSIFPAVRILLLPQNDFQSLWGGGNLKGRG